MPLQWLARGEHELPDDRIWLTPREAQRAAGMRFTKRRTEYLLRRWVGKQAVALVIGARTEPAALARIEVANQVGGAPYVLVDGKRSELNVSLTDRAGWAVCLVGPDVVRVGCDLELVEVRSTGFVSDFLTEDEQAYVTAAPDAEAGHTAANLLWSAKESALKVLGTGLRRDTRTVAVTVGHATGDGWGPLTTVTSEGVTLPGWWRREGAFLLTVAADRPIRPPATLAGSADLGSATPVHSWLREPVAPEWHAATARPSRPSP